MPQTKAMRKPARKAVSEKNDAQRNAARRVKNGLDQHALPIAEQQAGTDCDSSVE
jgi:hypothetical protein